MAVYWRVTYTELTGPCSGIHFGQTARLFH
jgi:hypothetical protein